MGGVGSQSVGADGGCSQIRSKMLDAVNALLLVEDEAVVERIKVVALRCACPRISDTKPRLGFRSCSMCYMSLRSLWTISRTVLRGAEAR